MTCERCQQLLIEIERYGDRLIGCVECNCWQSNKSAFIVDLSVGDIQALRKRSANTSPSTTRRGRWCTSKKATLTNSVDWLLVVTLL